MTALYIIAGLVIALALLIGWSALRIAAWADRHDDHPADEDQTP